MVWPTEPENTFSRPHTCTNTFIYFGAVSVEMEVVQEVHFDLMEPLVDFLFRRVLLADRKPVGDVCRSHGPIFFVTGSSTSPKLVQEVESDGEGPEPAVQTLV